MIGRDLPVGGTGGRAQSHRRPIILALLGCGLGDRSDPAAKSNGGSSLSALDENAALPSAEQLPASPDPVVAYPRARWRLAGLEELNHVVLWASHILIRHAAVQAGEVPFCRADWTGMPVAPGRSRDEAWHLAKKVQSLAAADATRFAQLAEEYSEDVTTQRRGGSLGGVKALEFILWPQVLDTFSAIRPGEVSNVVETSYGFHIFLRRPPPPETTVSGSRIVIGHDNATWLHQFQARGRVPLEQNRTAEPPTYPSSVSRTFESRPLRK